MRATAPTNVSPARRAPTWVAGKGHKRKAIITRKQLFEPLVSFESYNHRNNFEYSVVQMLIQYCLLPREYNYSYKEYHQNFQSKL